MNKLVSIATDGAPAMTGKQNGFALRLLQLEQTCIMCPNDPLTRQPAAQMVFVNVLYLDSRNLFCKTATITFTHFSHWSDAILSTQSVSHSLGPMTLGKDLSPYPSTVLYSAVAVALPNVLVSLRASGKPNLWTSSITAVPPPRTSSINRSLLSLACLRTCDMRRVLTLGIHFRSWKIPRPPSRTGACRNAFGVSFGNFHQRRVAFLMATSAAFKDNFKA